MEFICCSKCGSFTDADDNGAYCRKCGVSPLKGEIVTLQALGDVLALQEKKSPVFTTRLYEVLTEVALAKARAKAEAAALPV